MTQSQSYKMVLGEKACLILSNGVAFALLTRFGRRPLWLTGLSVTLCGLLIIGGMSFAKTAGAKWGTVAAIYIWNMSYDAFLGPNCYAMVSEVSSTRLRAKSVALSKWSQSIVNTVGGVINPYMINPAAWNWKVRSTSPLRTVVDKCDRARLPSFGFHSMPPLSCGHTSAFRS